MPWSRAPAEAHGRLDRLLDRPIPRLGWIEATPVERIPELESGPASVWVKRDETCAALYGGNKARKLDYILAQPRYRDSASVLGLGGIGSHHLVALAVYGAALQTGLETLCFDQVETPHVRRNFEAIEAASTRLWRARSRLGLARAWLQHRLAKRDGPLPTYLPPGASTPVGGFGHVCAALETTAQVRSGTCPSPRKIFVTVGTAGTAAGLAVGFALAEFPVHLHLVSAVERFAFGPAVLMHKANGILAALRARGLSAPTRARDLFAARGLSFEVDRSALGRGYGWPSTQSIAAVELAARGGLQLEATYTGKCVVAMRTALRADSSAEPVMFWNTHAHQDPLSALKAARQ